MCSMRMTTKTDEDSRIADTQDVYDVSIRLVAGYVLNIEAVELYGVCIAGDSE